MNEESDFNPSGSTFGLICLQAYSSGLLNEIGFHCVQNWYQNQNVIERCHIFQDLRNVTIAY
jgi:hypothetical protein